MEISFYLVFCSSTWLWRAVNPLSSKLNWKDFCDTFWCLQWTSNPWQSLACHIFTGPCLQLPPLFLIYCFFTSFFLLTTHHHEFIKKSCNGHTVGAYCVLEVSLGGPRQKKALRIKAEAWNTSKGSRYFLCLSPFIHSKIPAHHVSEVFLMPAGGSDNLHYVTTPCFTRPIIVHLLDSLSPTTWPTH